MILTKQHQSGFTLLEVLVSLALFAIASATVSSAFSMHLRANDTADKRSGAITAAQHVLDRLRTEDPSDMPDSGSDAPETVTVEEHSFTVTINYCVDSGYCISDNIRMISILVELNGETQYQVDTVYAQLR
jgi:type II secretion system protein I